MMGIIDYIGYGWKYSRSVRKGLIERTSSANTISYVADKNTENWILGAKARRLSRYSDKSVGVSFIRSIEDLLEAEGYFYLHHSMFSRILQQRPGVLSKKNIVMFTHPVLKSVTSIRHMVFLLNKTEKVIFLNKAHAELLISKGLQREKTTVMHLASDAEMFLPHERTGQGKVVVSMGYYERKNPQLLVDIVMQMPHRHFILIGKEWDKFSGFEAMKTLPNLEYYDSIPYEEYPKLYAESDVFLSTSKLEGGPVPLLETMLCNIVPVASRTGYCIDIIKHGENGFLFDIEATAEDVSPFIDQAFLLKKDVRADVIDYTWQKSAKKIDRLFD